MIARTTLALMVGVALAGAGHRDAAAAPAASSAGPDRNRPLLARFARDAAWLKLAPLSPHRSGVARQALVLPPERAEALRREGHGFVELLRRIEILRVGPGVIQQTSTHVRHFLDEDGVRAGGNLDFVVSPMREQADLVEAWVALPGGERVALDLSTVQVTAAEQPGLFSDVRRVTLPFGGLVPGASAVMVVRSRERLSAFPLRWSRHVFPRSLFPVERFELLVRTSDQRTSLLIYGDDPELACGYRGRNWDYACERQQVPPAALDPDVSNWLDQLPHVVIAEPQTWEDLAAAEMRLVQRNADAGTPAVKAQAARLVAGAKDDWDRIDRLHRFVADRIRYVGLEHGRGAVEPRRASLTLARGFGDCKDKVTLFLALARSLGIPVVPALVATGLRDERKFLIPSPAYFDHMIACTSANDRSLCLDLTVPGLPTGQLPVALRDRLGFAIGEGRTGLFRLSDDQPVWRIAVEDRIEIGCDGTVRQDTSRRFEGAGAAAMRAQLRARTAGERRRFLEEEYARVVGAGRQPVFTLDDLDAPGPTFTIRAAGRMADRRDLATAAELKDPDRWLRELGGAFLSANRYHAFHNDGVRLATRVTFQVCGERAPHHLGPALDLQSPFGTLTRRYQAGRDTVTVSTDLALHARAIPPAEIPAYNRFLAAALAETEIWFSLAPARAKAGDAGREGGR
jgi:hypothetical protein